MSELFQQVTRSESLIPLGNLPLATPAHQWLRETGTSWSTAGRRNSARSVVVVVALAVGEFADWGIVILSKNRFWKAHARGLCTPIDWFELTKKPC